MTPISPLRLAFEPRLGFSGKTKITRRAGAFWCREARIQGFESRISTGSKFGVGGSIGIRPRSFPDGEDRSFR